MDHEHSHFDCPICQEKDARIKALEDALENIPFDEFENSKNEFKLNNWEAWHEFCDAAKKHIEGALQEDK